MIAIRLLLVYLEECVVKLLITAFSPRVHPDVSGKLLLLGN